MFLSVTGISHDTASLAIREQLTLAGEHLAAALGRSRSQADECVILSTCNRTEIYTLQQQDREPPAIFAGVLGEPPGGIESYLYSYRNEAATSYLFRVVAGVDSLILGEVQILGQVQRAWQAAHKAGAAGPVLSQLFHRVVALGKRVHSETSISRHPASVSYAAVLLARQIFGPQLAERRALVIGTGEIGEGVARCLSDYGVRATLVAHRQMERAQALATRYKADIATWDDLPGCLAAADIVISSTSAPHYILPRQQIEEATHKRGERPLYLIDLAVPRDIDPAVSELPGVHLHNLDDLQAVVSSTLQERRSALPEIEIMIQAESGRFSEWLRARSTAPAIRELQAQADEIVRNELAWAANKLPSLSEQERRVVEILGARITGKLLHGPIQWLKAQGEGEQATRFGASTRAGEPSYGIDTLSVKEFTRLFYRSPDLEESDNIEQFEIQK